MRKFGVEIEFRGDLSTVLTALRAHTDVLGPIVDSRHTHSTGNAPDGWAVKRDGSVSRGGELVSPPLDFDDPDQRAQVNVAVQALQEAGAQPCEEAGIHVHIEANNVDGTPFTAKQIGAVVRFCWKFEDAIYRVASSGWTNLRHGARQYAQPIPEWVATGIMRAKTLDAIKNLWCEGEGVRGYHGGLSRYVGLNLHSYWLRNTVEFRYFNSTVNPERVQGYIALCMAIMEDARMGHSRQVKTYYPMGGMESGSVKESALLLRMQQVLTQKDSDTHALMSKEDWKTFRGLLWKDSKPQPDIFGRFRTLTRGGC